MGRVFELQGEILALREGDFLRSVDEIFGFKELFGAAKEPGDLIVHIRRDLGSRGVAHSSRIYGVMETEWIIGGGNLYEDELGGGETFNLLSSTEKV